MSTTSLFFNLSSRCYSNKHTHTNELDSIGDEPHLCLFSSAAGKSCRSQYSLRYRSAYFCLIVAFVLLGSTNATNTSTSSPTSSQPGLTEKIKTWVTGLWKDSNDQSTDNSTTANQSFAQNGTSGLAHGSDGLSHVRWFFSAFLQLLAQLFMIVSFKRLNSKARR